jgi:hypothetical protein
MTMLSLLVLVVASTAPSAALQLIGVLNATGNNMHGESIGVDFTVYSPIAINAVGVLDADEPGIVGPLSVYIMDRANNSTIFGPYNFSASARADDANPFIFQNVSIRLDVGVYVLVSNGFTVDKFVHTGRYPESPGEAVVLGVNTPEVVVTNGVFGAVGSGIVVPDHVDVYNLYAAATFLFTVPAKPPLSLPSRSFADCEEVACAGLAPGEYNIRGQLRHCDADGWMRLWRVTDSTCEQNGWTSSRNPNPSSNLNEIEIVDPFGCRPGSIACSLTPTERAPFLFRQVRATDWSMWQLKSLDGSNAGDHLCDGVTVRDASNNPVFVFAAVGTGTVGSQCPCEELDTTTLRLSGAPWTCGRKQVEGGERKWELLSANDDRMVCKGTNQWHTLAAPQSFLRVSLCLDSGPEDEDLKLLSGDLYVRATENFDTRHHCRASEPPATLPSMNNSSTSTSTTSTLLTNSAAGSAVTAVIVDDTDSDAAVEDSRWIVSTVIAVIAGVLLLIVSGALIFVVLRSRGQATSNRATVDKSSTSNSVYESPFSALK